MRIFKRFKEEGIEIPFPIRTVQFKQPGQCEATSWGRQRT
jgi:small-conductance mechanosensitive channel